jgi:hypothetical protein
MMDDPIVRLLGLLINFCWYGMGLLTGYLYCLRKKKAISGDGE